MNVIVIQFRICMYVVIKIKTRSGSRPTVHFMRDRMLKFYFILYDILINRRRTYQRSPLDCQVRCPVKPKNQNQNDTNYLAYLQSVKISKTKHIQVNILQVISGNNKKIWKVCMIFDSKQNVADIFYTKQIFSFKNENKFSIFFWLPFAQNRLLKVFSIISSFVSDFRREIWWAFCRIGHPFFSKECNVLAFFSVLYKRTELSLCSFPFFIKERNVLFGFISHTKIANLAKKRT